MVMLYIVLPPFDGKIDQKGPRERKDSFSQSVSWSAGLWICLRGRRPALLTACQSPVLGGGDNPTTIDNWLLSWQSFSCWCPLSVIESKSKDESFRAHWNRWTHTHTHTCDCTHRNTHTHTVKQTFSALTCTPLDDPNISACWRVITCPPVFTGPK